MSREVTPEDVRAFAEKLKIHAADLARENKSPDWWCVAGYADILTAALKRIDAHERRAVKVYGTRAVTFTNAVSEPKPNCTSYPSGNQQRQNPQG